MNWILVKTMKYFFLVCYLKSTFWRRVSEICMIYLQDACKFWSLQCQEESYHNALNGQRGRPKINPWIKKNTSWEHKRPFYLQNSVYAHDNRRTIRTSCLPQTFTNTKAHAQRSISRPRCFFSSTETGPCTHSLVQARQLLFYPPFHTALKSSIFSYQHVSH